MNRIMRDLWDDESGVTAVEYGLIAGLIGAVLVVVLSAFGDRIEGVFGAVNERLDEAQDRIGNEED